jgi:AcrR family transcriptional regulator
MTSTAELGLRERKKAATRQALHDAALRLAIAHGGEVTVEAIADEVGVSRRTFSNYFANKEEALLYGETQRMQQLVEMVRARPAAESPWTALSNAAADFYSEVGELDPELVAQGRLVRSHPALIAAQVQTFAAFERELAAEVAGRQPLVSVVRSRLTAAAFLTAMRVSLHVWRERGSGTSLGELITESLTETGRGFE